MRGERSNFIDEVNKTEGPRDLGTCPVSHSRKSQTSRLDPRSRDSTSGRSPSVSQGRVPGRPLSANVLPANYCFGAVGVPRSGAPRWGGNYIL